MTQDHLGSPRVITDAVGNVIARKDFSAFGDETLTAQRTTALGYKPENIRQDYTGYQKDDESGLEFAQARYYNSAHGRFTSVDPLTASASIRDPQTFNRYSYALNSPYKFIDPLGLIASEPRKYIDGGYSSDYKNGSVSDLPSIAGIKTLVEKYTRGIQTKYQFKGDFYDREGTFIGTDGIKDNKIYLLNKGRKAIEFPCDSEETGDKRIARIKRASTEVGALIVMTRTEESEDSTTSNFETIGGVIEKDVSGFMLEPAGPSTTTPEQDKRVPEGVYDLTKHSGKRHKNTFVISNEDVSKDRAILFHAGISGADTEGCIMPGGKVSNGSIEKGTIRPKMDELRNFIKSEEAKNVKLIIRNRINN